MKKVCHNKNGGRGFDSRNADTYIDTPLSKSGGFSEFDINETPFDNISDELDFLSTATDLDALSTDEFLDMLST